MINQYRIELDKINSYNYAKHHILYNYQSDNIEQIAANNCGLHAARLSTPYVTLFSRMNNYNTNLLWDRLYDAKQLIKIRCMRKTLHILPFDVAPIAHKATLSLRLSGVLLKYKQLSASPSVIENIKKNITEFIAIKQNSSENIIKQILSLNLSHDKELIKIAIKDLWENGVICYVNTNKNWGQESRLYALTRKYYPSLDLDSLDEISATQQLIFKYISAFGPVTFKDICWWTGLSSKKIKDAIEYYEDEIILVKVADFSHDFYMTVEDVEKFEKFENSNSEWLALLAYEDPALKGYHESRFRYVESKYYNFLFNQIGEVRASILLNGVIVGIWNWDKTKKYIQYKTFDNVSKHTHIKIKKEVEKLEKCFNNGGIQTRLYFV